MLDQVIDVVGGGTFVVVLIIVIVVLLVVFLGSRYKVAGADEALVRSGRVGSGTAQLKVVRGGAVFVLPLFHKVGRLKLNARQISVTLTDAVTRQGIKVAIQGVATFKIGADDDSIRNSAERFLNVREDEVDSIVKNVLEGSLRSIVGTLTVEELNLDRQKFQQAVQDTARGDLATTGLIIDSFTIQAIGGEALTYLELLGQQQFASAERDARMAKAAADQAAAIREAEAQQAKLNAQRDVELREADVAMQVSAADARADQAGPLAQAEAQQEVVRRQTELAELEAQRKAKELLASTVRPAEAEAEAVVKRAEGDKTARIRQAEADAERVRLAGEAEANVTFVRGEAQARVISVSADADAHRVEVEGNAEAGIIRAKGESEAKALALKAEAYRQFNDAAVLQTVLSMLPDIVRAAAEPMGNIDSLTVLSNDGASDLVKNATRALAEASQTVKGMTGIDVPELVAGAIGGASSTEQKPPVTQAGGGGGAPRSGLPGRESPSGERRRKPRATPAVAPVEPPAPEPKAPEPKAPAPEAPEPEAKADASRPAPKAEAAPPRPAPGTTMASAGPVTQPSLPPALMSPEEAFARAGETIAETWKLSSPGSSVPSGSVADQRAADAARRLAARLEQFPDIDDFRGIVLSSLARSGSRSLRTMWRVARENLGEGVETLTIGELLDRYGSRGRPH